MKKNCTNKTVLVITSNNCTNDVLFMKILFMMY